MRTVMPTSEVCHTWAQQCQDNARNSSESVFFQGDTIYSYGHHFPMARILAGGRVLITTRTYSVTTSGHLSQAWRAVNHLESVQVNNVKAESKKEHLDNVKDGIEYICHCINKAKRARTYKDMWNRDALTRAEELTWYAKEYLPRHKFNFDLSAIGEESAKIEAREKKRKAREAKKREKLAKEKIEQWIDGLSVSIPYGVNRVFLRVQGNEVQTSQGAFVPYDAAKKSFAFMLRHKANGWKRNGETFAIGQYQLDAVNDNGIIAGCHRIDWQEINRFAQSENWIV